MVTAPSWPGRRPVTMARCVPGNYCRGKCCRYSGLQLSRFFIIRIAAGCFAAGWLGPHQGFCRSPWTWRHWKRQGSSAWALNVLAQYGSGLSPLDWHAWKIQGATLYAPDLRYGWRREQFYAEWCIVSSSATTSGSGWTTNFAGCGRTIRSWPSGW